MVLKAATFRSVCKTKMDTDIMYVKVILMISLLPLTVLADSEATVVHLDCDDAKYTNGSAIQRNIDAVLDSTVQSVSQSHGFNTSSHGENPNKVYGLAQCRGDMSPSDCQACASSAKRYMLQHCQNVSASINLDGCFLRYETYNFYSKWDKNDTLILCNTQNSTDPKRFNGTIARVLSNVAAKAISNDGFSANSTNEFAPVTIYSMAQCWRDLGTNECRECLAYANKNIFLCDPGALGAQVVSRNCYLRYEVYKFFNLSVLYSPPPAPSSALEGSGHKSKLPVILGTIGAALVVLLGLGLLLWKRNALAQRKHQNEGRDKPPVVPTALADSKLNFKYETLKKATENFDPANKLGEGAFGSVYKGIVDGREIAVKKLFLNTRHGVDQFFNEVNLISRMQHRNLVRLLGCSADGPERLLIYEYLPNRSLDKFLSDPNKSKVLDWQRRFDIVVGTARGLAYLHEESEIRIIHRDIKASNILLDENMKPKISDFGLARFFAEDRSHLSTGVAGTLGYIAPEYVLHGQLTEKADVFSFGVLVLEIVTGRKNNSSDLPDTELPLLEAVWKNYESRTLIPEIIDPDLLQANEEERALRVVHVALLCTQASATLRPAMSEVVLMLTTDHPNLPLPTQPAIIDVTNPELKVAFQVYYRQSASADRVSNNDLTLSAIQPR